MPERQGANVQRRKDSGSLFHVFPQSQLPWVGGWAMSLIRHMRYIERVTSILLIAPLLTGCASLFACNYRTFVQGDDLWAEARLRKGVATYHCIAIGNPERPFDVSRPLFLRTTDGVVLSARDLEHERIRLMADRALDVSSDYGAHEREVRPEYLVPAKLYISQRFQFVFNGDKLITLIAYMGAELSVDGSNFYKLPISEPDLEKLFGPPTSLEDYFLM